MSKQELRQQIRKQKRQYSPQQLAALSFPIVTQVASLIDDARTVMAYWSLPDEVDTHQLISRLINRGVTVVLPRVTGKGTMELRRFLGTTSLTPGAFGIMEPTGPLFTDYDAIDAVVVPGMAFTADGRRLGRGGGYYDRLLPQLHHARRIGVAFPFQLVADIPEENHDATVDQVVCQRDNEK